MSSLIDGLQRILRTAPPNQIFVLTTAINFINSHTGSLAREAAQAQQLRALQAENERLENEVDQTCQVLCNTRNLAADKAAEWKAEIARLKEALGHIASHDKLWAEFVGDVLAGEPAMQDEPAVRLVEVIGPASDPDDAIEIPPWRPE